MLFGPRIDIHELPVEQPTTQGSVAHERRKGGGVGLERSGVRLGLLERQNSGIKNYQKLCCNHLGKEYKRLSKNSKQAKSHLLVCFKNASIVLIAESSPALMTQVLFFSSKPRSLKSEAKKSFPFISDSRRENFFNENS